MHFRRLLVAFLGLTFSRLSMAEPDFYRIELKIDIDKPAADVWKKVGGYCDIGVWLDLPCEITSGDGGMGTVRELRGGAVIEPMVALGELSYGYSQPVVEGVPYNFYHGYMEAQQVTETSSRIIYTVMWDRSHEDDASFNANVERRTELFTRALQNMKEIAEGQ